MTTSEPIVDIRKVSNHYEVYVNRKFYCTADTVMEAVEELQRDGLI